LSCQRLFGNAAPNLGPLFHVLRSIQHSAMRAEC